MTLLGSQQTALGSVPTASEGTDDGGGEVTATTIIGKFTGMIVASEGDALAYMADPGRLQAEAEGVLELSPQLYPTAARTFSALRVTPTNGNGATAYTVTLYKNGAPTAQQVTIPAAATAGTVVADVAHPIAFAADDKFDVAVAKAHSADASALLSAVIEGTNGGSGGGSGGGPVASVVTGLTFPIVSGTPTLTAGSPVILPGELGVEGQLFADDGLQVTGDVLVSGNTQLDGTTDLLAAVHAHTGAPVQIDDTLTSNTNTNLNGTTSATGTNTLTGTTSVNGVGNINGQPIAAVIVATTVNGSGTPLSGISAVALAAGSTLAWVASVGAYFRLQISALPVDHITVETASGLGGAQWLRLNLLNAVWEAQATWWIDPQNSSGTASDENSGFTNTTQLRTYGEHARRLFDAQPVNVTVSVSSNLTAGDAPSYSCRGAGPLTFQGVPTVLHTGAVTTFTNQVSTAAADDIEIVDATIPASFTASGLLVSAVLFKRTNGAARYWWASKDLGGASPACTLRISVPNTTGGGASTLANGDTYTASTLPTAPALSFPSMDVSGVALQFLDLSGDSRTDLPDTVSRNHCWASQLPPVAHVNPGINAVGSAGNIVSALASIRGATLQGLIRGSGIQSLQLTNGQFTVNGPTLQGVGLLVIGPAFIEVLARISIHDVTTPAAMLVVQEGGRAGIQNLGCIGGKGNTVKIANLGEGTGAIRQGGQLMLSVATPWVTGSTTDTTPITLANSSFTVATIAALQGPAGCNLTGGYTLSGTAAVAANGTQAIVTGATGPAGIGTPGAPTGWKQELIAGVVAYTPFWT